MNYQGHGLSGQRLASNGLALILTAAIVTDI
jgi:hypothetical protein